MPTPYPRKSAILISAICACAAAVPAAANERPGRFTMSPAVGGGFVRLDTQSGQMSLCNRVNAEWKCEAMSDEGRGLAAEVDKLRAENKRLQEEVRRLDDLVMGMKSGPGSRKLELPSEEDVDRAMTYLQRMIKKFQDKLKEFEPNHDAKPQRGPATPL